jgi:hypothetical protein
VCTANPAISEPIRFLRDRQTNKILNLAIYTPQRVYTPTSDCCSESHQQFLQSHLCRVKGYKGDAVSTQDNFSCMMPSITLKFKYDDTTLSQQCYFTKNRAFYYQKQIHLDIYTNKAVMVNHHWVNSCSVIL